MRFILINLIVVFFSILIGCVEPEKDKYSPISHELFVPNCNVSINSVKDSFERLGIGNPEGYKLVLPDGKSEIGFSISELENEEEEIYATFHQVFFKELTLTKLDSFFRSHHVIPIGKLSEEFDQGQAFCVHNTNNHCFICKLMPTQNRGEYSLTATHYCPMD